MAAPTYSEDLTDIDLATDDTPYDALGGGGAGLGTGADFAMQGTACVDKQITNAEKGMMFDNGTGITMGTGDHVFQWLFLATPGLADLLINRGLTVAIGSSVTAYCKYHVEGSDTYGAGGRVGKCYVIDQTVHTTNSADSPEPENLRTRVGTPSGTFRHFGGLANTTAAVKGGNFGVDAMRYGTGAYITAGESGTPGTFAGFATQNDSINNRWGILTDIGGTYELQGYFVVGQNNAGTATAAYFADSDVNIVLVNTVHAASDFTRFVIDHASTTCLWTNINITALGTINPGRVIVESNNPTFTVVGGSWTGIDITTLRSNSTVTGLTWRGTGQITLNGATLTDCVIDSNTATSAVVTDDLADITGCVFTSAGTGHAVELNSVAASPMAWDNTATGYADNSPDGDETIYVNVGSGSLTINVAAGATTPTIRTAGATVTVNEATVTLTINCKDPLSSPEAVSSARVLVLPADGTGDLRYQVAHSGIFQTSGTATVWVIGHGYEIGDKVLLEGATNAENYNGVKTVNGITSANFFTFAIDSGTVSPATGTMTITDVIIDGTTDASGNISDTRSYSVDQPYSGRVRKSTSSPFYKTSTFSGTLDKDTGGTVNVQMLSDE